MRTEAGTVNVFWPAVVVQMNAVALVTLLAPVPLVVLAPPKICTISDALPPVQPRVNPALSVTVAGNGPLSVNGGPRVIAVLNGPTAVPPAPVKVYVPATIEPLLTGPEMPKPSMPIV